MSHVFRSKDEDVVSLGDYKPYSVHKSEGGDYTNYPIHSGRILDLKENKPHAVKHFSDLLDPELHDGIAIAVVPSHDPEAIGGGLASIASQLATKGNRIDASSALRRTVKIQKLAHGGDRSITVHRESIEVADAASIKGKHVLLLDDVHKSGNSLAACKEKLLAAGAASVHSACLGKTWG
ncbi:ComF family protein [Neoaquamicrobium sediminum]|uniref:Phosphoribosyltransferase n=1 Tax=Neoaquamicrobium sediminum TaxID=1849104 RepID=A0ABV3WUV2_9HYPH